MGGEDEDDVLDDTNGNRGYTSEPEAKVLNPWISINLTACLSHTKSGLAATLVAANPLFVWCQCPVRLLAQCRNQLATQTS